MPHVLIAGKIHEAGLTILKNTPGFTWDLVEEVSTASYAPLVASADALLLRTQPLTANETWHKIEPGEFALFHFGERLVLSEGVGVGRRAG